MTRQQKRKEETRRALLDASSRAFRSHGYAGIGVDAIARAAGATSGAFYAHLGSKDAAFRHALEAGLDEVIEAVPAYQKEHGSGWTEAFADYYLGAAHRKDLACGCAMTALTPEVVRAGADVQQLYEEKMLKIAALIAGGLSGGSEEDRLNRAWAFLSILIGALSASRAVAHGATAETIAAAARKAALAQVSDT